MNASVWTRLLLASGFAKLAGVVVALSLLEGPVLRIALGPYRVPLYQDLLTIAIFGGAAALLLLVGHADRRVVSLGGFFVLVATAFCWRPLLHLTATAEGGLLGLSKVLHSLKLDAFMPFFLWRFVRDFPKTPIPFRTRRAVDVASAVSAVVGGVLVASNVLLAWWDEPPRAMRVLSELAPKVGEGLYHLVLMPLMALALPALVVKARAAPEGERRRAGIFVAGLGLGLTPAILEVLVELAVDEPYHDYMAANPEIRGPMVVLIGLLMLSVPVTTIYAVLVHRVLGMRLMARRALQYLLARYTVLALAATPLMALGAYLLLHRHEPLAQIFSGIRLLLLLGAAGIGLSALRHRKPLLDAIDRRFFREQYDARQILTLLVERIRTAADEVELAALITAGIDRALHLEGVWLLVHDPKTSTFIDPGCRKRRLDASSHLARLIFDSADPLVVDLTAPRSPFAKLPEEERRWLAQSGLAVVVPVVASDGTMLAMIGLGEKKSGLPFLREDRQLLAATASSAALVLELQRAKVDPTRSKPSVARPANARECPHCSRLFPSYTVLCTDDSQRLKPTSVPYVLPGKYRFERRIGTGGMGIVYRACDLALGRPVAIKTLRRISPVDGLRLLREARAAAAVAHPHLAAIYGVDVWQERPMLVLELLEGGTLTERVTRAVFTPEETVELGLAMAAALERLHGAGILHRDVKPSNIGYARDDTPKLMDFGIAQYVYDSRRDPGPLEPADDGDEPTTSLIGRSDRTEVPETQRLVGTLSYLSPEALEGRTPDVSFDLWSLAVVLYECLLGKKIFGGDDQKLVMTRILMARIPDPAQALPGLPPALADFFREALARDPERRPASAAELKARLAQVESVRPA